MVNNFFVVFLFLDFCIKWSVLEMNIIVKMIIIVRELKFFGILLNREKYGKIIFVIVDIKVR